MATEAQAITLPTSTATMSWEAPEFISYDKGRSWHVTVWSVAVALTAILVWLNGLTFFGVLAGIVPLAAALALTTQAHHKPKTIHVGIDEQGVAVAGELHRWEELKSFWLVLTDARQVLYLETTRRLLPFVTIELADTDPDSVRRVLATYLPEHEGRAQDLNDRISQIFRF